MLNSKCSQLACHIEKNSTRLPRRIELSHNQGDELWPDIAIVENLFFLSLILCSLAKLNFCLGQLQPTQPNPCNATRVCPASQQNCLQRIVDNVAYRVQRPPTIFRHYYHISWLQRSFFSLSLVPHIEPNLIFSSKMFIFKRVRKKRA